MFKSVSLHWLVHCNDEIKWVWHTHIDFEYLATDADNVVEGVCVICEEGVELIRVNIPRPGQRHVPALSPRSRQSQWIWSLSRTVAADVRVNYVETLALGSGLSSSDLATVGSLTEPGAPWTCPTVFWIPTIFSADCVRPGYADTDHPRTRQHHISCLHRRVCVMRHSDTNPGDTLPGFNKNILFIKD